MKFKNNGDFLITPRILWKLDDPAACDEVVSLDAIHYLLAFHQYLQHFCSLAVQYPFHLFNFFQFKLICFASPCYSYKGPSPSICLLKIISLTFTVNGYYWNSFNLLTFFLFIFFYCIVLVYFSFSTFFYFVFYFFILYTFFCFLFCFF